MTREEIFDKIYDLTYQREIVEQEVHELLDEVIVDFEKRTCDNCKWHLGEVCTNDESPLCANFVHKDFGCNKFKRKDEG